MFPTTSSRCGNGLVVLLSSLPCVVFKRGARPLWPRQRFKRRSPFQRPVLGNQRHGVVSTTFAHLSAGLWPWVWCYFRSDGICSLDEVKRQQTNHQHLTVGVLAFDHRLHSVQLRHLDRNRRGAEPAVGKQPTVELNQAPFRSVLQPTPQLGWACIAWRVCSRRRSSGVGSARPEAVVASDK